MASITSWVRIEARSRDPELLPGIEARLHDPLWAIARQWQLGELTGRDAGSAIAARAQVELARVDAVRGAGTAWTPFDPDRASLGGAALATPVTAGVPRLAERAREGRRLVRLLVAGGERDAADWAVTRFPIAVGAAELAALDDDDRRFLAVVAGRAPDAAAAAATLGPLLAAGDLPAGLGIPTTNLAAVSALARAWLAALPAPAFGDGAWRAPELRHRFALRVPAGGHDLQLVTAEHHGGPVRWHDVDVERAEPSPRPPNVLVASGIPSRVRYRGMPARRYWELEDAAVYWPGVEAGPGDVGRVLLVEFAHAAADHWLVLPFAIPAASVARVLSLVATDTFGERVRVPSTAELDGAAGPWRFCELSSAPGGAPGLVFFPPAGSDVTGPPVGAVEYGRDDTSNVVWAIDRIRLGADGRPRDVAIPPPPPSAPRPADAPPLAYRLGPAVPDPMHPYRPGVRPEGVALVRATVPGQPPSADRDDLPAFLVPGALAGRGLRVARKHHLARSSDGAYHLHAELETSLVGTPGAAPELVFDHLEERE
jgi:hypothetical protein